MKTFMIIFSIIFLIFGNYSINCELSVQKSCNSDSDCSTDPLCRYNLCKCEQNFNSTTKSCVLVIEKFCSEGSGCYDYDSNGFNKQVCVGNKCRCKPNYKLNNGNNKCTYFDCGFDSDCEGYNRICVNKICICSGTYEPKNNLVCENRPKSTSTSFDNSYLWFLVPIPLILLIIVVIVQKIQRRIVSTPSTPSTTSTPHTSFAIRTVIEVENPRVSRQVPDLPPPYCDPPPPYSQF